MYSKVNNLILGFHGCDQSIYDEIIKNNTKLVPSENTYDWLGHGIYFWENNLKRAWEWALIRQKAGKIQKAAVIGVVLDLGYCLNLIESDSLQIVKSGYEILCKSYENSNKPLPKNRPIKNSVDLLLRDLDCAVIETIHAFNSATNEKPYDSIRAVFMEGNELYPNSGFREKNHIQICIRNPNCIKGYFAPLDQDDDFPNP
jgi:hypothetical protein